MRPRNPHRRWLSSLALLTLAGAIPAARAQEATAPPEKRSGGGTVEASVPVYTEGLQGVDLSGLTPDQRHLALRILNEVGCTCGCRMTVAQCRVEDQNCPRSPVLARAIVDAVRRGEDESGVRAAYQTAAGPPRSGEAASVSQGPTFDIPIDTSPVRGDASAPVTIVEFSDFQCPYCARAVPILQQVLAAYPGKVKLVYKHLPLPFHAQARLAARAAEAASDQGKFWEMHDLLFRNARALDRASLLEYARQIGLDMDRFRASLDGPEARADIERDLAEARRVGANGTPTFFVNGRRLPRYQFSSFQSAIEAALDEGNATSTGR